MQAALSLSASMRQVKLKQLRALSQLRRSLRHLSLLRQLPAPRAGAQAKGEEGVEAGVGGAPPQVGLLPPRLLLQMMHKVQQTNGSPLAVAEEYCCCATPVVPVRQSGMI